MGYRVESTSILQVQDTAHVRTGEAPTYFYGTTRAARGQDPPDAEPSRDGRDG